MVSKLNWSHSLDWAVYGSWNVSAGASVTLETVSGRDFTRSEVLVFAPFAHNRFQSSTFCPRYSIASYNQKVRVSWMWDSAYEYVDVEKVDNTHFKLTASANLPGDFQLLCFGFVYYGNF